MPLKDSYGEIIPGKYKQGVIPSLSRFALGLKKTVYNFDVMYSIGFCTLCIVGYFDQMIYSILLLDILERSKTLKYVVKSVWNTKLEIINILFFWLLLQYMFALIEYKLFPEDFHDHCYNIFYCWIFTIDQTFKQDGGVGGWLQQMEDPEVEAC